MAKVSCACSLPKFDFCDAGGYLHCKCGGVFNVCEPPEVKSETFDITQHEWSDKMANLAAIMSERGDVVIRVGSSWIFLAKQDGIAIAKALGVTAEDLK